MAYTTTETRETDHGFGIGAAFRAIGNFFVLIAESNSRVRKAETLNAMTDGELTELGLRREDITRHVFGSVHFM